MYLLSKALRPNVGKLTNPQPSPAVKNHWKKPQRKLKEKNFPNALTCFLLRKDNRKIMRTKDNVSVILIRKVHFVVQAKASLC